MRAKISLTLRLGLLGALIGGFGAPLSAQSTNPAYLFLLEGKGVPTGTIHGFSVNTATGALAEVSGSPFSAGLGPALLAADPTGRFLYVANQNSKDLTAFSIDPVTGSLNLLPGSPFFIGAEPVTMGIDPTGRFLYVFAGTLVNSVSQEASFEYDIDSASGALTLTSSSPTTWESSPGSLVTSIVFDLIGNVAYLGQTTSGSQQGPILVCAVDFSTGALTQVGSAQPASIQSDHLAISPSGNFLYSTSARNEQVDAFAVGSAGGLTEVSGSPYPVTNLNFPAATAAHPSGSFLYVVNENQAYQTVLPPSQYAGAVSGFSVNAATGALAALQGAPFPAGINAGSIGVDPTGSFAFVPSTNYVTGTYTGFAQIQSYSINPSSGTLSAPVTVWTDLAQSIGSQLVITNAASGAPNPTPAISSLSPSSTTADGPAFTLQVTGTGFVSGSRAYFAGQPRATIFVNSNQLNVSVLATDIANEGTAVVFVFNPLPGGGASTSVEFAVASPAPVITAVSPTNIVAGTVVGGVTVTGSNFLTSSVVNFNGSALATQYINSTVIRAQIPGADIGTVGTATITVTNPSNGGVGGGTSNGLTVNIVPAPPKFAVTGISPTSVQAGGPAFTLTVSGTAFAASSSGSSGSQISFGLANVPTTVVSSTQLTAAIPATAIAIAGNPYVIVTNPDGSTSTPISFTVTPGVGAVNPPGLPAGSSALTLNVTGTGFEPSSIVLINGSPRPTTYINSTLLQVTLLPSDIAQGGTLNITVLNPPAGGGVSPAIYFAVEEDSLSLTVSSGAIAAGGTATFTLAFSSSSGAISNPVDFTLASVTPHAAGAAASFAPSVVPPGASPQSVVLSVRTQPRAPASVTGGPWGFKQSRRQVRLFLLGLISAFFLAGLWLRQARGEWLRLVPPILALLLFCALATLAACSEVRSGSSSTSPPASTGTPAGAYTITVTATSAGVSRTIPVTMTVM